MNTHQDIFNNDIINDITFTNIKFYIFNTILFMFIISFIISFVNNSIDYVKSFNNMIYFNDSMYIDTDIICNDTQFINTYDCNNIYTDELNYSFDYYDSSSFDDD